MRRELGSFESAEAWTGASFAYNAVVVLRLAGRPQPDRLEAALAAVQRRHPLLRARLERRGARWWFDTGEPAPIPLRRVQRLGDESWRPVAEAELDTVFSTGVSPLVRCVLVASAEEASASEIVLAFHHAVTDAVSGATVCRQLLEACGGGAAVVSPEEAGELPPRPEDRFPARFRGLALVPRMVAFLARQLADETAWLWRSRGVRSPPPPAPTACRVLPVALGEAPTRALVRHCRRRRLPLNAAANAALLLALQRHRYHGRAVPVRYFAFPDLRPYLEPPVGPETVGSYLTTMRFARRLAAAEPFWPLAAGISRQLQRSFRRGEKFLFALTSPALLRRILRFGRVRLGSAAVSYTGPVDLPAELGGLGLVGVHAFVSNLPVGPEISALARLFRGRLWWDFVYLDGDMDEAGARALAAEVLERLEGAAREPD